MNMDVDPISGIMGVYAGLLTLGLIRGTVRLSIDCLISFVKLIAVALVTNMICSTPVAVAMVATAAFCFLHSLPSRQLPAKDKCVFITGCDRGLGQQLAIQLDSIGMHVFAGCLFPDGEATLKSKCSERLRTVPIDVSNSETVRQAAEIVKRELGDKELWGVVNNAGICYIGCMEVVSEADIRRLFEVNFMGQVYVTRAFLPLLRASRGRLVNVASNAGLFPAPFMATYCASKAAVAGLSESLRMELRHWGIRVSTIIPSGYRTGILLYDNKATGDRWWAAADEEVQQSYGRDSFYPENKTKDYVSFLNPDFSAVVSVMQDALLEKSPKACYYKGLLARSVPYLYSHLPTCIADYVLPPLVTWYKFDPPALHKGTSKGKETEHMKKHN